MVFLNSKPDKEELPKEQVEKIQEGHMANIKRLAKEGKLLDAGPFEGGGGIFILNTASVGEATEWLSTDPGVKAKRWNIEILLFTPRIGTPCKAPEPIEMVTYEFVRYIANITKYNVQNAPETARKHDEYLKQIAKTGNVILEGTFGEDGGILIMKGALQKEVIESDPSLNEGLYQVEFKKLFIAKGSFCER